MEEKKILRDENGEIIKLSVKALAAHCDMSITELAERSGINSSHLKSVSNGRATMTGTDLICLSIFTNISPFNIKT